MNGKRFWVTIAVAYVALLAMDFLLHGVVLANQYYMKRPDLFRMPTEDLRSYAWLANTSMFFGDLIFVYFFMAIFVRGVENRGWIGQGLRYGGMIWGVSLLPAYVIMYGWSRYPGRLLLMWMVVGLIECVVLGWICAALYRGTARTPVPEPLAA